MREKIHNMNLFQKIITMAKKKSNKKKTNKKKGNRFKSLGLIQTKNETWLPGDIRGEVLKGTKKDNDIYVPEEKITKNEHVSIFDQKPHIVSGEGMEESLQTVKKLIDFGITIGSPTFLKLGAHFVSSFERLKLLQEVSKNQSQITNSRHRALDRELADFLINKFAVKESNPIEGNIRNILQQIADDQKINIHDASLMIKPDNLIYLLARGAIIKKGNNILQVNIKKLAGKSELISEKNINATFNTDSIRLNTQKPFCYIIKIDKVSKDIICQLYKDGNCESQKELTEWLKTK